MYITININSIEGGTFIVLLIIVWWCIRTDSVPRTLRGLFIFCATLTLYGDYPSPNHIQNLT